MVRDILIDTGSCDVQIDDNLDENSVIFDTVWGNMFDEDMSSNFVYLNIIVPANYISSLIYDTKDIYQCNIKAEYYPSASVFYIRFVTEFNGVYGKISNLQLPEQSLAKTYRYGEDSLSDLVPTQLILINQSGHYIVLLRKETNYSVPNAEVYSMAQNDLKNGNSDDQSAKLLAVCASGKNYRYPTIGVGITDYINAVVENSDLSEVLIDEFDKNSTPVQDAEFDNSTGNLNVTQSQEQESELATTLSKEELDTSVIGLTDDIYLRISTADSASTETDYEAFLDEIAKRNNIFRIDGLNDMAVFTLNDSSTANKGYSFIKSGYGGHYSEVTKSGYSVVTANLKKNDIIKFKLTDDIPTVFITKTNNISEQESFDTKWVNLFNKDEYGSCGIVKEECYIHYCIKTSQLGDGECGVFRLDATNEGLRDLLVIVQDKHTSRLLGYATPNSHISNVQIHNITGQIFLTKLTDNE